MVIKSCVLLPVLYFSYPDIVALPGFLFYFRERPISLIYITGILYISIKTNIHLASYRGRPNWLKFSRISLVPPYACRDSTSNKTLAYIFPILWLIYPGPSERYQKNTNKFKFNELSHKIYIVTMLPPFVSF